MNTPELLPCPFCGNEKNIVMTNERHDHSGGYFIACPKCDASTGLRYALGDDPRPLLVEQWNRRTYGEACRGATLSAEQEREAFEKWFSDDGKWPNSVERDKSGYLLMTAATAWDVWQARAALSAPTPEQPKPLDDPRLQELFGSAISGALTFGYQNANPPPEGHWLTQFWQMGRDTAAEQSGIERAARAVAKHFAEFGPEHGFAEVIDGLFKEIEYRAILAARGEKA